MELLQSSSSEEVVEVVANVLIKKGFDEIGTVPNERVVDPINVFRIVMKDRLTNGETLENSMVYQGLTMLDWLSQKK